jgi:hypothetical protein
MTKFVNPLDIPQLKISIAQCGIIINNKGVDSIGYIIRGENGLKWLKSLGYMELEDYNHTPLKDAIDKRLKRESSKASKQNSYQKEDFKPFAKALKYNSEKGLSSYIVLYGNTQETLKKATRQKKSKDTFMLMEIHGLHQPTKDISVNTMKMLSKIIKRKAFKIHSYDLAGDGLKHGDINAKMKDKVKTIFDTPKCINEPNIPNIAGVKYYDKYKYLPKSNFKENNTTIRA